MTLKFVTIVAAFWLFFLSIFAASHAEDPHERDMDMLKKLGTAAVLYLGDSDDMYFPAAQACKVNGVPVSCPQYYVKGSVRPEALKLNNDSNTHYYWIFLIGPYLDSYKVYNPNNGQAFWPGGQNQHLFMAPGARGMNVGGQNSYGYNALWLAPQGSWEGRRLGPVGSANLSRPAEIITFINSTFYVAAPDVTNESGTFTEGYDEKGRALGDLWNGREADLAKAEDPNYLHYWKNLGGSDWSSGYEIRKGPMDPQVALHKIGSLHPGRIVHAGAADTHVMRIPAQEAAGNICKWTSDLEGLHPRCAG